MSDLRNTVDFSIIRYANCWEDPLVLIKGLDVKAGEKILSIASAGDNSFSLLSGDPELVVAVDLSAAQLYLVELKMLAIKNMEREEYIKFAGFFPSDKRIVIFNSLKDKLSAEAKQYWEHNAEAIEDGIIYFGKFEKYFQMFSSRILPWIHRKKTVDALLKPKSADQQKEFYESKWNSFRWRFFFKVFFSRYVMGKYGRDPEFLKEVKIPVSQFIFEQAEKHLSSVHCLENFILHFNLNGNFGNVLPHYVQPGVYEKVRKNIDRLTLFKGYAGQAIPAFGKFHKMNLSNIFEYMDKNTFENVSNELVDGLEANGRIACWNLMVPRKISAHNTKIEFLKPLSENLKTEDKGFFYSKFIIEEKK
ncbi:MAG: DUF3419 family protein [Bacteroidia bacterium]|nr:DUF3419 family protein [Bacteroidia bacterium]